MATASDEASAAAKELPSISIDDAIGDGGKRGVLHRQQDWSGGGYVSTGPRPLDSRTPPPPLDLGATTSGTVDFADSDTNKTFTVATAQDAIG